MGKYINENSKGERLPAIGKVSMLIDDGATVIDNPVFQENLVCVIHNPFSFEAAGYVYSKAEFEAFNNVSRRKTWLIYPYAKELAG